MGALKAIRQSICVRVMEQRVVSIAPGKFLEGDILRNESTTGENMIFVRYSFFISMRLQCRRFEAHLGADTQVRIWQKFRLFM